MTPASPGLPFPGASSLDFTPVLNPAPNMNSDRPITHDVVSDEDSLYIHSSLIEKEGEDKSSDEFLHSLRYITAQRSQ